MRLASTFASDQDPIKRKADTMLASAWVDGARRAVVVDDDRVGVTPIPGLDAAVRGGFDVAGAVTEWRDRCAVVLDAPLRPPVVFCLGQTYSSHVQEKEVAGHPADDHPELPEFFLKAGQTIAAPGRPLRLGPTRITKLDYETELGVVIGTQAHFVTAEQALQHVFGYMVVNDLSARERQIRTAPDGTRRMAADAAKNFDGATVFGETVVPAAHIPEPGSLAVTTHVNGELRQSDTTGALLFSVGELIAFVSRHLTLRPGDVIATGTPGGTGWSTDSELGGTGRTPAGCAPGRYLSAGDQVLSAIERVGHAVVDVTA
ncbi:fumarylacetoacetate hydrolase family protein [Streptomyces sp. NPDC091972]|uniref:fumarylacetoacetate hydrolase family protein n=1 Tax=Streptomyces sp. NPDC091972 TaxID=3366007 RepID=UPI003825F739